MHARTLAVVMLVALAAPLTLAATLILGALAATRAGAEEPTAPAVSFGPIDGGCGSRPGVSHLSVPEQTPVLLTNATPGAATVLVDGLAVLAGPLAAGEGALVTLAVGQHEVRLAPACGDSQPLTVLVGAATAPTAPAPSVSVPVSEQPAPSAGPGPAAGQLPAPTTGRPRASTARPPATGQVVPVASVGALPSSAGSGRQTGVVAPAVLAVSRFPPASRGNPKGVRLLAAVATICLLGVTAAIIRSIVRLSP